MAEVWAQSDPVVGADGTITWVIFNSDGETICIQWDPKLAPPNWFKVTKVRPVAGLDSVIPPGQSHVRIFDLPNGQRATQMGNENGVGVDWIKIHKKGEFAFR